MCRLLLVKSKEKIEISAHLKKFAQIAKNSREYQGHGWGCAYLKNGEWEIYKNVNPIWEDDLVKFPPTVNLLAHARSAFQNEGINVENNMPFLIDKYVFIFNGELHGVKIKEKGRIGAEKVFNYIKRFDKGDMFEAIKKAVELIKRRTTFIRAMNFIIADERNVYLHSLFNDEPEYFTMHIKKSASELLICSEKFPHENNWHPLKNKTIEVFQ